ncbi:MAG TPA: hypothetical protein VGC78_00710 [Gaiellaceae bacterium]|jgi:tetratricopeptide (TPR) repeat protein
MSPTARMRLAVGLAAVAAAAVVAGVVYATRQDPPQPKALCKGPLRPTVVAGVPSRHLAAVRAALAKQPKAAALALEPVAQAAPRDPVVQFNLGRVLYCAGYPDEATQAFRRAKAAARDTYYRVAVDNLLHPQYFDQGYPPFQYDGTDPLLVQGQVEQRRFHPESAERLFARAARLHPDDPDAQVAAAVGRFDMDDLSASFSRLGPLVKRFPHSQSVRFHLGLLLVWIGERKQARTEFRAARDLGPATKLGRTAAVFLRSLAAGGSGAPKR